jgi:hypothetical protein
MLTTAWALHPARTKEQGWYHRLTRNRAVPGRCGYTKPQHRRHLAGLSIRYDGLEPQYTEAEPLYVVHGQHGPGPRL